MPVDGNTVDTTLEYNLDCDLENIAIISAITPYQLVRHLMAPIILADSIKMTAMVDSGAMGNFIHPRFVEEHELVMTAQHPLTINDVNGCLLSRVD